MFFHICMLESSSSIQYVYPVKCFSHFLLLFFHQTECIPRLVSVIEHPESKQPENVNATENAISAVVKICKYNGSKVNVDDIIPRLVHWLPVTEDVDEAVHIYDYVCDLLEA